MATIIMEGSPSTGPVVNICARMCIHVCSCGCHTRRPRDHKRSKRHAISCCSSCGLCGQLIKTGSMEDHKEHCHPARIFPESSSWS